MHYNLQQHQALQRVPSLQTHQVVQPIPARQKDQQDQDHHGDHEDHPYQRDQKDQGVQQYPKKGRRGTWVNIICDCVRCLVSCYSRRDNNDCGSCFFT